MMNVQKRIRMNNLILKMRRNQKIVNEINVKDISTLSYSNDKKVKKRMK